MKRIFITGGAGFVGSNLADHFLRKGEHVTIYDNMSRRGVEHNIKWLQKEHGHALEVIRGDVRDFKMLKKSMYDAELILHCSAQVAVTTSIMDPVADFDVNAKGSLNVLEVARQLSTDPVVAYCSTNKCYGDLREVELVESETRYDFKNLRRGIDESFPLKPVTPYGVSKCLADLYCLDYYKTYGLKTIVFRMSCIYGPHQYGTEDQAWIAWFILQTFFRRPITIYGDGKQVRDVLYIDDLKDAFELATKKTNVTKGEAYNIGGGVENTTSLLELISYLEKLTGNKIELAFDKWRIGDQLCYYSDISKARLDFGWAPKTSLKEGVKRLYTWITENRDLFK